MPTASSSTMVSSSIQIPIIIFLCAIVVPLHRLAADRTVLYILLSKTCFNIAELCLTTCWALLNYWMPTALLPSVLVEQCYSYAVQSIFFALILHNFTLALNRLFAVFVPSKYMQLWNKRNTHLAILVTILVGLLMGSSFVFMSYTSWLLTTVQYIVLATGGTIYGAIICNFAYEFCSKQKEPASGSASMAATSVEKDRMLLCLVCILSIVPLPLGLGIEALQKVVDFDSPWGSTLLTCHNVNYAIMQFLEQMYLMAFCRDFRVLVKQHYFGFLAKGKEPKATMVSSTAVSTIQMNNKNLNWISVGGGQMTPVVGIGTGRRGRPFVGGGSMAARRNKLRMF